MARVAPWADEDGRVELVPVVADPADQALPGFVAACDRHAADPSTPWPASLRVRDVENAPGIWELTWSFSGPDGRATFEWVRIDGTLAVRWRRIGGHAIFRNP